MLNEIIDNTVSVSEVIASSHKHFLYRDPYGYSAKFLPLGPYATSYKIWADYWIFWSEYAATDQEVVGPFNLKNIQFLGGVKIEVTLSNNQILKFDVFNQSYAKFDPALQSLLASLPFDHTIF